MFVVTYNSLEEFKEFAELWAVGTLDGRQGRPLSVRISQREYHEPTEYDRKITHFVALQVRLEDEIHLCKFEGPQYHYMGKRFDSKGRRIEGLEWSAKVNSIIVEFCAEQGYRVLPGWIWIKDLGLLVGSKLENTPLANPLTVRIEVRGGVAHVIESPSGVSVEIVNLDVEEVE